MPSRLPSPSSPTLATNSSPPANSGSLPEARQARAMASKAASPAPLSETPGPWKRPPASTEISPGLRGASTVSRCAVSATYGGTPNAARTLPARSMLASQPYDRNCSRNQAARSCSRKVGAGTRQSCTWTSLIHCFSRVKNCKHSRTPWWSASSVRFVPVNAVLAAMLPASVPGAERHKCSCAMPLSFREAEQPASIVGQDGILMPHTFPVGDVLHLLWGGQSCPQPPFRRLFRDVSEPSRSEEHTSELQSLRHL